MNTVSPKVTAAGAGAAAAGLVTWVLQTYVFHGEIPVPVAGALDVLVPGIVAFVSGWLVRHEGLVSTEPTPPGLAHDEVNAA